MGLPKTDTIARNAPQAQRGNTWILVRIHKSQWEENKLSKNSIKFLRDDKKLGHSFKRQQSPTSSSLFFCFCFFELASWEKRYAVCDHISPHAIASSIGKKSYIGLRAKQQGMNAACPSTQEIALLKCTEIYLTHSYRYILPNAPASQRDVTHISSSIEFPSTYDLLFRSCGHTQFTDRRGTPSSREPRHSALPIYSLFSSPSSK